MLIRSKRPRITTRGIACGRTQHTYVLSPLLLLIQFPRHIMLLFCSVYISTVGEEPVADAPVSSSLTQRCGGADQGAAAVSASDYATDAATIADAENRADAHSKAHDLSLVPGFRPTPRLLAPQASDEAEAGDERVPEVSWTAPSSPTIVALLAALYAFIPSGAKLPSSFSCVPQSQLPVPHPCAERVASDDTAALSTSSSPTPPPPLRSVALQLLRHVVHDRRLQQRLLRHYVDHKTTVAALNAASVALGGHSAPLSEDAPIDSLIDNVSALPAQAPSSAASQAALASSREFQSSPTLDLSGDSASSPSLVGGVSAATPSVDDKLEARRARIRVVMEQTITPGHRAFASQDDGAVKDVSAIASHSQSDVPAALASPTDSKPSLGIINSFASPFSALSASSLASSVASFFRVPSFFSSSSPSQESVSISASSAIESDAALAAAFAVSLVAPLTAPIAPVPASLTPVQFGLRALYARYLTRCQHALKAKQSHVHLIAVMKGWCLNRLQLGMVEVLSCPLDTQVSSADPKISLRFSHILFGSRFCRYFAVAGWRLPFSHRHGSRAIRD